MFRVVYVPPCPVSDYGDNRERYYPEGMPYRDFTPTADRGVMLNPTSYPGINQKYWSFEDLKFLYETQRTVK